MTLHAVEKMCKATTCVLLLSLFFAGTSNTLASQNNLPETYIVMDTLDSRRMPATPPVRRPRIYYSLPQPTATFTGIPVRWMGSDSLDHPGAQPPFEFNWILFGPFPDKSSALPDSGLIVRTNDDIETPAIEWTSATHHDFFDLRSGWYLFWVRARDDSLGIDPTPAMARFQVAEPSFDKPFMLLDATNWLNGRTLNAGSVYFREPRTDSLSPDSIRKMYESLFEGHGYEFDPMIDTWYRQVDRDSTGAPDMYRLMPNNDILSRYKSLILYEEDMIVVLDMDNIVIDFESALSEYLDVGGRVVLIGRNLFGNRIPSWSSYSPALEFEFRPTEVASNYFAVTHMYFPGNLSRALAGPPSVAIDVSDFTGTLALDPEFPTVSTDTMRTLYLSQVHSDSLVDRDSDGSKNWLWIPDVNTLSIDADRGARGIYNFNSAVPDSSISHGELCGAHYEFYDSVLARHTFRTAIFTFPFFPLKQDSNLRALAREILDLMLGDISSNIAEDGNAIRPNTSSLWPNYPNPFNVGTGIRYSLSTSGSVKLTVFNLLGRRVATLVNGIQPAGEYDVIWNGTDAQGNAVSSGVYFYRLTVGDEVTARKMLMLK